MFQKGGAKPSDVEHLVQQSHQLLWAYEDVQRGVPELVARLREAQGWAQKACSLAWAYSHAVKLCFTNATAVVISPRTGSGFSVQKVLRY